MNGYTKTAILFAGMTAFFGMVGYLIAGTQGMIVALGFAGIGNLYAYWNSDKLALKAHKAIPVDETTAPSLYNMTRDLADRGNMPMPALYVMENDQPNAFATGRNPENAAVAVTTGLLARLNNDELAGVIAHELAHIKNHDTLLMTVTATLAGAISVLANFGMLMGGGGGERRIHPIVSILVMILAPIAAMLIQMAISRAREFEADRVGAEICGSPQALANALDKIAGQAARIDNERAENAPSTAHMFIINPLHARAIDGLFATHPPTAERIRRLAMMQNGNVQGGSTGRNPWY